MKRMFMLLSGMAMACTAALADAGDATVCNQTVVIDGSVVSKFVTGLTFDGDDVVLAFDDNTTQTADMSLVSIDLTYDGTTETPNAITEVGAGVGGDAVRVYTLSGQYAGSSTDGLTRGLYIVNGKKVIIR